MRHAGDVIRRLQRQQVWLYLLALAAGAALGLAAPPLGVLVELAITPVLALLMFATFLGVPFADLGQAARDLRFLSLVLVLNFVVVPVLVFGLSRFVAGDADLLLGVLLVLLTPCVDYVVAFTGLAGGARERLLAVTPVLMIAQILLLPVYLWLMAGPDAVGAIDAQPFLQAFGLIVLAPLVLAVLVQLLLRHRIRAIQSVADAAMVPLMMLTLAIVVASQIAGVAGALGGLLQVVPVFLLFALVAGVLGGIVGRLFPAAGEAPRAIVLSGVTRNSLVVLPLALAASPALVPLVVVTQTLVELLAMVIMVAVVPRLSPGKQPGPAPTVGA